MKWVRVLLAAVAAVVLSGSVIVTGAAPADASASASGEKSVASRLAGGEPKAVENCGKYTCTTYHNRAQTKVLAEDLPPILKTVAIGSAAKCMVLVPTLAKAVAKGVGKAAAKRGYSVDESKAIALSTAFSVETLVLVKDAVAEVCKSEKQKTLESMATQAALAVAANGCLEEERKNGKSVRVGYTTHPDWCGGS